ncbi:3-hydroxyacyl-CoA dehydrogenase [Thioclava dalianensis]|uniref:3-hydroxyacyl-CoA dehydrogenase n=1 Tax=Thioclava dalianensis TaxID=1185766 RepID=A0A074T8X6_9RHOB|nr:3-hydroxyacyl-CoA dehydrogenase NAD-binding domain-containing protein [Thioclava dalianensis]KEP68169.1 3-hydroxyacyl-CoA dehydrogenase [Thioclava dalianensis]SFN85905.1 3-hydroxybutyryl-CoA dehydrogenase [Thioclava dalianensis]
MARITVLGAGLMGHGIALTLARAGHAIRVTDPVTEARTALHENIRSSMTAMGCDPAEITQALDRVEVRDSIAEAVSQAEVVFEAAPEKLELKQRLFAEVEACAPTDAILASNTSVMPITSIMSGLSHRGRALGTHWWNPAHMIPLVEVIATEWTDPEVMDRMVALLADAGKAPVKVARDVPGFIGNRLQHALWREAISLVEHGICDAEGVDTVVKQSFGRRLAVLGPLENADLVGTDLTLDIHQTVLADLERRPGPSPYLEQLVETGHLGMKTGEGFRRWSAEEAQATRDRVARHLNRLETILDD